MTADGLRRALARAAALLLPLFALAQVNYPTLRPETQLAVFAGLGLVLVFGRKRAEPSSRPAVVDVAAMAATIAVFGYVVVQSEPFFSRWWVGGRALGERAGLEGSLDIAVALLGMALVFEATRRTVGVALPILAGAFLVYGRFGASLPDWLLPHRGYDLARLAAQTFLHSQGVFGIALRVMFTYVFLFVLFGALLEATGTTAAVVAWTQRLFRKSVGAPAKVAVVSSGLLGSLSGSAVANTATTGTFTIPMMRGAGFRRSIAGGIEAAASTGGALVPPVMGAGAYMMLELVEPAVTYLEVVRAALLPAILYYLSLLLMVHLQGLRDGIGRGLDIADAATAGTGPVLSASPSGDAYGGTSPPDTSWGAPGVAGGPVPPVASPEGDAGGSGDAGNTGDAGNGDPSATAMEIFIFIAGLGLLLVLLIAGFSVFRAVTGGIAIALIASAFHPRTRLGLGDLARVCRKAAKSTTPLIAAAACVGIIIGVVTLTGIGTRLPSLILSLAQGQLLAALALIMVSSIVLGMGLPSAVCYLLMATLVGPALGGLGVVPLAAHLFIFYFGMMSMVTPPVALAAYTASSIAGSKMVPTSVAALRYALVGFALPFVFVFRPQLLMLDPLGGMASAGAISTALAVAIAGIVPLGGALAGYWFGHIGVMARIALGLAAAAILLPAPGSAVEAWKWGGLALVVLISLAVRFVPGRR